MTDSTFDPIKPLRVPLQLPALHLQAIDSNWYFTNAHVGIVTICFYKLWLSFLPKCMNKYFSSLPSRKHSHRMCASTVRQILSGRLYPYSLQPPLIHKHFETPLYQSLFISSETMLTKTPVHFVHFYVHFTDEYLIESSHAKHSPKQHNKYHIHTLKQITKVIPWWEVKHHKQNCFHF